MKTLLSLLMLAAALCSAFITTTQTRSPFAETVAVTGGLVSGTVNSRGDVRIFKGIPFAAPPLGDLRWRAPQPVVPWDGVRTCTAFGPSPMQSSPAPFSMWSAEFLIPNEPISEDCLYLNIWTGASGSASKPKKSLQPVLVWIYGGGFTSGGSAVPIYDGEASARKGVVFVSINYRVGPFGFLAHPELTRESGRAASGNYGLMDQLAALRWVKQNIAQFGGDPANVTIAGQSAGAMSVNCLVASPLSGQLFQKAIAESGGGFTRPYPDLKQAEANGLAVMQALGASSLLEMRARPAAEIMQKARGLRGPIVDGYVLPKSIAALFKEGRQQPVNLLTGWNEDEGLSAGPPKNVEEYRQQLADQYGSAAPDLLRYYPGSTDAEAAASQRRLSRDLTFGLQNYTWANAESGRGRPVYVYRFTRRLPATGVYTQYGAFHTGEVAYAYDNLRFIDHALRPLDATDEQLASLMSRYWVNFVKTGNPNGRELPVWPRYTPQTKTVMALGDQVRANPLSDGASLDFLFGLTSRP